MPCGAYVTRYDKAFSEFVAKGMSLSNEQKICPGERCSEVAGPTSQGFCKKKAKVLATATRFSFYRCKW